MLLFRAAGPERKLKIHLCWSRAELEEWAVNADPHARRQQEREEAGLRDSTEIWLLVFTGFSVVLATLYYI